MQKGPLIDHDPRETPRPGKGETTFVTIVTVVVLVGLGSALKWVNHELGLGALLVAAAAVLAVIVPLAFWLERTK
ncbi:hypothetical protein E5S70_17695 [Ensifer adhaerens]|uniref:hypothetical protein n=1 Tax=Ensifer canadensis TaxID=555315 RepID=UPI0014907A84|nr:hypothetical protein [Ensifer canadensis]NOV17886.1 hypothetical protein [Ensifer canadensis]